MAIPLRTLVGVRRKIVFILFSSANTNNDSISDPVTMSQLAQSIGENKRTVETTSARLVKERIIIPVESKRGRGGWVMFKLARWIHDELSSVNSQQLSDAIKQSLIKTDHGESKIIDNSSIYNNANSVQTSAKGRAGSEKSTVNYIYLTPLAEINVEISESEIASVLSQGRITTQQLIDSIEAFVFDVQFNNRKFPSGLKKGFVEIIRNGPYGPPSNYENEKMRVSRENIERFNAYSIRETDSLEQESDLSYRILMATKTEFELRSMLPEFMGRYSVRSNAFVSTLKLLLKQSAGKMTVI